MHTRAYSLWVPQPAHVHAGRSGQHADLLSDHGEGDEGPRSLIATPNHQAHTHTPVHASHSTPHTYYTECLASVLAKVAFELSRCLGVLGVLAAEVTYNGFHVGIIPIIAPQHLLLLLLGAGAQRKGRCVWELGWLQPAACSLRRACSTASLPASHKQIPQPSARKFSRVTMSGLFTAQHTK